MWYIWLPATKVRQILSPVSKNLNSIYHFVNLTACTWKRINTEPIELLCLQPSEPIASESVEHIQICPNSDLLLRVYHYSKNLTFVAGSHILQTTLYGRNVIKKDIILTCHNDQSTSSPRGRFTRHCEHTLTTKTENTWSNLSHGLAMSWSFDGVLFRQDLVNWLICWSNLGRAIYGGKQLWYLTNIRRLV